MSGLRAFPLGLMLMVAFVRSAAAEDASRFDWSGFYVGGHVAYGRGHMDYTVFDPDPTQSGRSFGSLYGGLQMGYNYVLRCLVPKSMFPFRIFLRMV